MIDIFIVKCWKMKIFLSPAQILQGLPSILRIITTKQLFWTIKPWTIWFLVTSLTSSAHTLTPPDFFSSESGSLTAPSSSLLAFLVSELSHLLLPLHRMLSSQVFAWLPASPHSFIPVCSMPPPARGLPQPPRQSLSPLSLLSIALSTT